MKFPIMLRSTHHRILSEAQTRASKTEIRLRKEFDGKLEFEKKDLYEVVQGLTTIALIYQDSPVGGYRWRVLTDIDPMAITMALERGDDDKMIEYIAEGIKHKIMRELKTCNIQRPDDFKVGQRG